MFRKHKSKLTVSTFNSSNMAEATTPDGTGKSIKCLLMWKPIGRGYKFVYTKGMADNKHTNKLNEAT